MNNACPLLQVLELEAALGDRSASLEAVQSHVAELERTLSDKAARLAVAEKAASKAEGKSKEAKDLKSKVMVGRRGAVGSGAGKE